MTTSCPQSCAQRRHRRGFSLVEVLIAVLIMAIGLLGLGAVIPVVVREQRLAADATAGVAVGRLARDVITERLTNASTQSTLAVQIQNRVSPLDAWLDDLSWSQDFNWEPWGNQGSTVQTVIIHPLPPQSLGLGSLEERQELEYSFDRSEGEFYWQHEVTRIRSGTPEVSAQAEFRLTARDRLWPSAAVLGAGAGQDHRPQFVWDFIARRVDTGVPLNRQRVDAPAVIEVAVFVRRIDLNIRVPRNRTFFEILTNPSVPMAERRLPVAVDANGVPTGNGTNGTGNPTSNAYAAPLTINAEFDDHINRERRTLLLRDSGPQAANSLRLAAQPGQRLVDNLGHVYTVREVISVSPTNAEVLVDPPVPSWVPVGTVINRPTIRQVVFTPQVPAAVSVFRITRPVVQP